MEVKDLKDSYFFSLTVFEDQKVEFFGKAYYMDIDPYDFGETTSKYELWISKSNDLPYRVRREMSHDISVTTRRNAIINTMKLEDFRASDYFEPEYAVELFYHGSKSEAVSDLTGNNFNYTFLMSTPEVTESYKIKSVPVFFILDENRVIIKVIKGYGEGTTDKEIRDAINELIR